MAASILRIRLLGEFSLTYDDEPLTGLNKPRLQSLLAYLILHAGAPVARQHLAFVLWPDTDEAKARNNLRQGLHQLRQALPEPDRFLAADGQALSWQPNPGQLIDVQLFQRALAEAEAAERRAEGAAVQQALEGALASYSGDLLPSCYDDWIIPERERLQQQRHQAVRKLVEVLEAQQAYPRALQTAQQLLRLDPLAEETYMALMRLHSRNHDRQGVRRVYQSAIDTFQRELGLPPNETLRQAYQRWQLSAATVPAPVAEEPVAALALVGRQPEWLVLQAAWRRAVGGDAQLALATGEAGVGKSRLAEELFHWVRRQGFTAAYTRCYAAEGRLSLAPVTEWLRSDALRPRWAALDGLWLTEVARSLPELLTERADLGRPAPISELGQRQRYFEALARAMLSPGQPLLLWIDDLQWCDPETLEWLHFLLRFQPGGPLLVLGTARTEESPSGHPLSALARQLRMEDKLVAIELGALDAAETAKLAAEIKGQALDVAATMRLFHETEGNPLFVVETLRAGLGSPAGLGPNELNSPATSTTQTLPPRVYALMASRLAQLSAATRKVAELGAAVGRSFTLEVLRQASSETEETIVTALDDLWQKRIVREQSVNCFDFTHDKLREVTYAEIGGPQRRLLHRRVAQALEALNAGELEPLCTQIAAQYDQAGLYAQALPYYQRAGSAAADVFATNSALELFSRALALLAELPPGVSRDKQELGLLLLVAPQYRIAKGWASPEVERAMNRALVLCNQVGDVAQRAQTLYGLQTLHVVAARLDLVQATYTEAYRLFVETEGHPPPPFAGLMYAGAQLHMGQVAAARERFEGIIAIRDDRHIRDLQASQGVNYLAHGHAWNSHALWYLGYPQQALEAATAGVQFAIEFVQPFNRALSITYLATLQEMRADRQIFQTKAEEALALSEEYKAPYYQAWAAILVSFARTWQEPGATGLARLQAAIDAFTATGARLRLPYYLSLLARAQQQAGQLDEALATVARALTASRQNYERWWEAELIRLQGELLWSQGAPAAEVEAVYQQSIAIAQAHQARSLELRAATSLARLWQAQGRLTEAHQLLASRYDWFTEGFDTPDLQAAQGLISQL
jgi:DNA-binding SARP family transcriptional activator/predicted ATPase